MAKKQTYVNNGGQHKLPDGTLVKRGQTFESEDPDICKKFPNKFSLANATQSPVNAGGTEAAPGTPPEDPGAAGGAEGAAEDVSADFDLAADPEGTLTVLKEGGKWNVYEDGDTDALNDKPLTKGKVQGFVDSYLAED